MHRMITLGIPESVAYFIEDGVPKRVGARHYMTLGRQADRFYKRYANYVADIHAYAIRLFYDG